MENSFGYFILSYGKPYTNTTLDLLKKFNVKYPIYLVVGKDDPKYEEYLKLDIENVKVIVFDKNDFLDTVNALGQYNKTHKICTYARQFVDDYARENGIRYCCILFDDILDFRLRYFEEGKIKGNGNFDFNKVIDEYINMLNISDRVIMVGPPGSSFYIGISKEKADEDIPTHYGNMFIYDINKPIGPFTASILEDMDIVLQNSNRGYIGIFPFGLQVVCRKPMATADAYQGIGKWEYIQQYKLLTRGKITNPDKLKIPYKKFLPKILNEKYRKKETTNE